MNESLGNSGFNSVSPQNSPAVNAYFEAKAKGVSDADYYSGAYTASQTPVEAPQDVSTETPIDGMPNNELSLEDLGKDVEEKSLGSVQSEEIEECYQAGQDPNGVGAAFHSPDWSTEDAFARELKQAFPDSFTNLKDEWPQLNEWAKANMPKYARQQFNRAINSNDPALQFTAARAFIAHLQRSM